MSIGARLGLLLAATALMSACTADSEPADAGNVGSDASLADLGVGADGGADAGPVVGTCEEWCPSFLACRRTRAVAELDGRGVATQCTYPDEAAALARCVAHCQTQPMQQNLEGSERPTPACLACHLRKPGVCEDPNLCKAACNGGRIRTDGLEYEGASDLVCWGPEGPAPELECTPDANRASFSVLTDSELRSWTYEGPVVVENTDPWSLRQSDGTVVQFSLTGVPGPDWTVGATVTVALSRFCPWWCETSMVGFDAEGRWNYVVWSGSPERRPELPGLELSYQFATCHSARPLCGGALTLDLVPAGRGDLAVAPGQQRTLDGVTYSHGAGSVYFELLCLDFSGGGVVSAAQRP